jgi:hypothetical protein
VFQGIEVWQMSLALVGTVVLFILLFFSAMARFLKRPSPSEAIIRIGRVATDVFIARACWIVPVLHRATVNQHLAAAVPAQKNAPEQSGNGHG